MDRGTTDEKFAALSFLKRGAAKVLLVTGFEQDEDKGWSRATDLAVAVRRTAFQPTIPTEHCS